MQKLNDARTGDLLYNSRSCYNSSEFSNLHSTLRKKAARRKTKGAGATVSSHKVCSSDAMYSAVNTGFSPMVSSYK